MPQPTLLDRASTYARFDLHPQHRQPTALRFVLAGIVAIAASLVADAALVAIGVAAFPTTRGYAHFQFADYSKLTVIGVVIAACAWPVVTHATRAPRWLFARLAVLVTAVLLLPDAWLLYKGQPRQAVGVLVAMHFAIAVVTYCVLVYLAPARRDLPPSVWDDGANAEDLRPRRRRR